MTKIHKGKTENAEWTIICGQLLLLCVCLITFVLMCLGGVSGFTNRTWLLV